MVTLILVASFTFVNVIISSQSIENVVGSFKSCNLMLLTSFKTSRIFETLTQVDWSCWNSENQKMYLIFLANAQQIFQMKFSESIIVNYELGVSVSKF
jgi:hypothetical protein